MKKLFLVSLAALFLISGLFNFAEAKGGSVHVNGYYRSNGTYVQPHYRSAPDGNPYNNWSYPGNTNPYTGKVAPGNPNTYLNNYYNTSGINYSADTYSSEPPQAYSAPILSTNDAEEKLKKSLQQQINALLLQIAALQRQLILRQN